MSLLISLLLHAVSALAASPISFTSTGNPILASGTYYSADPAPLVVNNTLYIISGRDQAPLDENAFTINGWQVFVSSSPDPTGSDWTLHPAVARPEDVFSWAAAGTAYAAQIVQGKDDKFYLYAPVTEAASTADDKFAIGVAVSSSPLGPFVDAHPSGPILSQSLPEANTMENIDPTVFVDDDGKAYIYEGTFGELRGYALSSDMTTVSSASAVSVTSLTGFFEAPWLTKRGDTYYMLYAANNAGTDSPCTPTSYHACVAYGTSPSPLGPWTFRGVVLGIVSSTTSHPGAVQLGEAWYLAYHTADAVDGGHFRRSVALDQLTWDDSQAPPAINPVVQTRRPGKAVVPTRNVALQADASSLGATPIQYWTASLNDGKVPSNPLPPDYWCSYDGTASLETSTLVLTWNHTVTLNGTRMAFFADQAAGANEGVPPPKGWTVEYKNAGGEWAAVDVEGTYPTEATDDPVEVGFAQIETTALRAILTASGSGGQFGGVGVKEWEALAPTAP